MIAKYNCTGVDGWVGQKNAMALKERKRMKSHVLV